MICSQNLQVDVSNVYLGLLVERLGEVSLLLAQASSQLRVSPIKLSVVCGVKSLRTAGTGTGIVNYGTSSPLY